MDAETQRDKQQAEVDANFAALQERLPELLGGAHARKFALMKDRKIVEFFDTRADAIVAGNMLFTDGVFSANEITDEIVDLGFHSRF